MSPKAMMDLNNRIPKRSLIAVFLVAFLLRILVVFVLETYRTNPEEDHFGFGWEMGRVARSVTEGQGFSSPLPLPTGPTAIVGPVYPLILALIFKVFGVYTTQSAIAARIIQSVFSSVTCVFLYLCGRDSVGARTGTIAAWIWAVFPLNVFFSAMRVWETSLTSLLVTALFWALLSARDSLSPKRWSVTGALLGCAALTSTSLVVLVVPFGLSALWRNGRRIILPVSLGALASLAVVTPWLIRNYVVFNRVMLRSNFPLEFRVGNNLQSYGQKVEALHPSNTLSVNRHWQEVGELRFMAEDSAANAQFVSHDFGRFAVDTGNRIVNYWTAAWIIPVAGYPNTLSIILPTSALSLLGFLGILQMFVRKKSCALMYAGSLFIYPLVYYLTTSQLRFYHAVTPLLILSGTFWVLDCKDRVAARIAGWKKPPAEIIEAR